MIDVFVRPTTLTQRATVMLEPEHWEAWLRGSEADARALLQVPPVERFDLSETAATDAALARLRGGLF